MRLVRQNTRLCECGFCHPSICWFPHLTSRPDTEAHSLVYHDICEKIVGKAETMMWALLLSSTMSDIVLLTVDSLRADHVGCYGYDRDTTPTIDDLSTDGQQFTNAFAHACSTRPSFPSILTSSYALMHGGFEQLSSDRTTIAEALSGAGYQTAGFHSNLYL